MDGNLPSRYSNIFHHLFAVKKGTFGIDWPNAFQHPYFYIGLYTAIGLANALVGIATVTAQYTGALRASRLLFKYGRILLRSAT